jgi:REP element-mobilizing transposase RayT
MTNRRLAGYDYRTEGSYFVTICTHFRQLLFVHPEVMQVVESAWASLPVHHPGVKTDVFVVMPNHVHGLIRISAPEDTQQAAPLHGIGRFGHVVEQPAAYDVPVRPGSLSAIVRSFKSSVSRELRLRGLIEGPVWQRNYWDRVIRNEDELNRIRQYIAFNPIAWEFDHENPGRNADTEYEKAWSWLERFE